MKTAEKLATGWLLTLGFMFMTISVSAIIEKNNPLPPIPSNSELFTQDYENPYVLDILDYTALYNLILGVPTSVLGIWMALGLYRHSQQEKKAMRLEASDRLQSVFYRLIQENHGRVTVLNFAMQSQLPATTAKKYLDEQAKQFNAHFQVNENGAVSYHFDV